jgi:serpin B
MVVGLLGSALLPTAPVVAAASESGADRAALVTSNSEFGLNLYSRLSPANVNFFFSPHSISTALAMTYAGARGATADEMAKTLRFSLPPGRIHAAFTGLIREINGTEKKRASELHTANALWSQQGNLFEPAFQRIAKHSYQAALEQVDFDGAAETARRTINAWVERQTQDRIKDLIREGTLGRNTALVLTNAIYFKGTWLHAFPKALTRSGNFALGAGSTARNVPLMGQWRSFRYLDADICQILELPYDAHETSMLVFLPRGVDGLRDLEQTLSAARVRDWLVRMTDHDVDVTLPRFKIAAGAALKRPLTDLGMRSAFTPGAADFSGMFSRMTKSGPLSVSDVVHKAHIDLDEKGTEAAAATGGWVALRSASRPRPRAVFRADHPFFFLIRDNRTGSTLFAGRLTDPRAG